MGTHVFGALRGRGAAQQMTISTGTRGGGLSPAEKRRSDLIHRLRVIVSTTLVPDATLLVATGGDNGLLHLGRARTRHFPEAPDGTFRQGPISDEEARAQLEQLRADGAAYLVIPRGASGWIAGHPELRRYVEERFRTVTEDEACLVFDLRRTRAQSLAGFLDSFLPVDATVLLIGSDEPALELPNRHVLRRREDEPADSESPRFVVLAHRATRPRAAEPAMPAALAQRYRKIAGRQGLCEVFVLGEPVAARRRGRLVRTMRRLARRLAGPARPARGSLAGE
jgi:hypothetical protein